MAQVGARSVSGQVRKWLAEGRSAGEVLAVHSRVCNLVTDHGEVIALVAQEIGDGPLNVVLGEWPGFLSVLRAGARFTHSPDRLMLDSIEIALDEADTWEPCPNWRELRPCRATIEASLEPLAGLCLAHDPSNALLPLLGETAPGQGLAAILVERFREAALRLEAGWLGEVEALSSVGIGLAGLGGGLTPAGDDFLVGVMLWAWLAHPAPKAFCRTLTEAAAPRTTILSAAFLRAAARGQCSAAWHRLLAVLAKGRASEISRTAQAVLAHGASSGLDALIGFLYLLRC